MEARAAGQAKLRGKANRDKHLASNLYTDFDKICKKFKKITALLKVNPQHEGMIAAM
jgi:hypothetical protein